MSEAATTGKVKCRRHAGYGESEQRKAEAAEAEAARLRELRSKLSLFERITVAPRLLTKNLSDEDRELGVEVFLDFENAMRDFTKNFNMFNFKSVLQTALRTCFKNKFKVLGVSGAGTFSAFQDVRNGRALVGRSGYNLVDIEKRWSMCIVYEKTATHGRIVNYERTSDVACDKISQQNRS